MVSLTALTSERASPSRFACGGWWGICVGMVLALSATAAYATALGSLATSFGVLGALAAMFVSEGLPAHLPVSALSTAAAALLIAAGAVWLRRMRALGRVAAMAGGTRSGRVDLPSVARPKAAPEIALPEGFQHKPLLAEMRRHFVLLQHAWDDSEMGVLRALTTPEMLDELCLELPGFTGGICPDRTEVVTLRATLLGFESLAQMFVISVEFSGLIRESAENGAVPFREVWLLTQAKHEPAVWRLARHQALI